MSKKLISWDDVALELPAAVKASLDADYDPAGAAAATLVDAAVMITEQSDADKAAAISTYAPITGSTTYAQIGTGSALLKYLRPSATILTNFEPGHGWTLAGSATNPNDTTDYVFGSQSAQLTAAVSASASATKTGLTAVDGTNHCFRLWLKSADMSKVNRVTLMASSDPTFTAYYAFQNTVNVTPENTRLWKSGEWTCMEYSWANITTTGAPTKAALTAFRVLVYADAGAPAVVSLNRLEAVPEPGGAFPNGVITLSFDDSFADHYDVARKRMSLYGMPGTLFPILERLDTAGYLTTAQVDELAFTHYWEIGGHATTYAKHVQSLTGMTSAERRTELGALRAWQQSRGYQSYSFAYPNGFFDAAALADLIQYFSQSRTTTTGAQPQVPVLPHRLRGTNANVSIASLQTAIDTVAATRRWLNIYVHDITTVNPTGNAITPTDFNTLIDYIAASGVPVRTMGEVLRANAA